MTGVRSVAALTGALVALSLTGACGTNKGEVCKDAGRAVSAYNAQLSGVAPDDIQQWRRAAAQLATRLDALAGKSDDDRLKRTLRGMAAEWRGVSTTITSGDISRLQAAVQRQPGRLARACR